MSSREEFVEKLKAQIDEWSKQLEGLEQEAKKLRGQLKEEYGEQIEIYRKSSLART